MSELDIARRAGQVIERAAKAAVRSGRKPEDVIVLAASKMNGAAAVRAAFDGGIRVFGENRAQELLEKSSQGAYAGAQLHFIGHLQRNKVRSLVGKVDLIESVDSQELLRLIGERAGALSVTQDVLIEVNIGGEAAKSGVEPGRLGEILDFAAGISGLRVLGLMAIPPAGTKKDVLDRYFQQMRNLFVDMRGKKYDNISMDLLSMGMSGDFEEAILNGANLVRVGTAIFGERQYVNK